MGRFVPLSIPNFEGNERKYVDDALDQGWVSTGGAYITELEEKLAEFLQVKKTAAERNFGSSSVFDCLWGAAGRYGDCSNAYLYRGSESGALSVRGAGVYGL
mgnify:CR=1 FL=1